MEDPMSGADSLRGFVYQQRFVTFRVLGNVSLRAAALAGGLPGIAKFWIEGRTSKDSPVWDVSIEYIDASIDLDECKDTGIDKDDRLVFYDRIRTEIASGIAADRIRPGWVTDPEKQSANALSHLEGIAGAALNTNLASLSAKLPSSVTSVQTALQEAVFRLCHFTGKDEVEVDGKKKKNKKQVPRACTFDEAKQVLGKLHVARHRLADFDQALKLLPAGLFSQGTSDAINHFVTGVLTNTIVNKGFAEFTVDGFLQAVGTVAIGARVEGRMRHLLTFSAASGFTPPIRLVRWNQLPGKPTTRWELANRLGDYPSGSITLVAGMGVGKTVGSQLAAEKEATQRASARVLRLEARLLDEAHLDTLVQLACLLAGVGPTWIGIDGLDEVPSTLRATWGRTLGALNSLPNVTLFVTVRREVLAVQNWLQDLLASLQRVTMEALAPGQVQKAFADVGLPVPQNEPLIRVLQNPFLLSLYADIVTPEDMPLATGGNATAFRVLEEFWTRRVLGESIGQRAVGDSEAASSASKRAAAVFLGERSLAGDLTIPRDPAKREIDAGVEMLLREGVLRYQGTGGVTFIHEWLREYAIVDTLRTRCQELTAVTLARRIISDCTVDQVARSAAAGGMKLVLSNPLLGTPADFLRELWSHTKAYAREAMIVLLEGPSSAARLVDLPDDLLLEALNLAVALRTPQWGNDVAQLDEARIESSESEPLHAISVDYELTIAPGNSEPDQDLVNRLIARDLKRWRRNKGYRPRTFDLLLKKAISTGAFRDAAAQEWLTFAGIMVDGRDFGELAKAIRESVNAGECVAAHGIFRSLAGFTNALRGRAITDAFMRGQFVLGEELFGVLETLGLLSDYPTTWGKTAIELLSALVEAKQRKAWPSTLRYLDALEQATGARPLGNCVFTPEFDEDPRVSTLDSDTRHNLPVRLATAIDRGFRELAQSSTQEAFSALADAALRIRFAAVIAIPLLVLVDTLRATSPSPGWHVDEAVRLLTDPSVAGLDSLGDVRRLLRRLVYERIGEPLRQQLLAAIRGSSLSPPFKTAELADLKEWGLLTPEELAAMEQKSAREEIREPVDPRTEKLFEMGRSMPSPEESKRGTGWPYPEEEEYIRLLKERDTASEKVLGSLLDRKLAALRVVLCRDEAVGGEWLGPCLRWAQDAVQALREGLGQGEPWFDVLEKRAPWWKRMAEAAIKRLGEPVPESHAKREDKQSGFSFNSGDPVVHALDLLNQLQEVDSKPPFEAIQQQLAAVVTSRWNEWPTFTKAAALSSLDDWFWFGFPKARAILADLLATEKKPLLIDLGVKHVVSRTNESTVPELEVFLGRALTEPLGRPGEWIGKILGQAAFSAKIPNAGTRVQELAGLFHKFVAVAWQDVNSFCDFLHGALFGALDASPPSDIDQSTIAEAKLEVMQLIVTHWPFSRLMADKQRFPAHAVFCLFNKQGPPELQLQIFEAIVSVLEDVLRSADLAAFCDVHHELRGLLAGGRRFTALQMTEAVERILPTLCRLSIERVAAWKKEGRTTDDLGWLSGLDGRDSLDLVRTCVEVSRDRGSLIKDLTPLADKLADAGYHRIASEMRAFLRNP
jgi:hypothetical protein